MSFRLDMHQTVQDIITKKQRLQFETQRLECVRAQRGRRRVAPSARDETPPPPPPPPRALASGHFFKAILPIMCDNGVITERRFMDLVVRRRRAERRQSNSRC